MKNIIALSIVGALGLMPLTAEAVCFKALNETNLTIRARVYDRGDWRPWTVMSPGYWDCFASSVQRTEHAVQMEYQSSSGWIPFYYRSHGSRIFTRVADITPESDGAMAQWYDEPPRCRDKPPGDGRPSSCLKKSGWLNWAGEIFKIALKVFKIKGTF